VSKNLERASSAVFAHTSVEKIVRVGNRVRVAENLLSGDQAQRVPYSDGSNWAERFLG
jgi:hypothetical protein